MVRLLGLVVVIVVVAVSVPSVAPGIVNGLFGVGAPNRIAAVPASPVDTERTKPAISDAGADGRRMVLDADRSGHFMVEATINGRAITAMVDTGASTVALSAETARKLGISPARSDFNAPLSTANGVVAAAPVTLDEVRVGNLRLRNVSAVVVPEGLLPVDLLGMSFLGRLSKFELSGPRLVLSQ
jgi:aspartyl protease family protein